jgi:hypothetical protein
MVEPASIRILAAGVFVATATSCSGGATGPFVGQVSRSQFFEYHDEVDEPLCPSLLSMLDEHALQIGGKIGLTLEPGDARFRYYKFRDANAFLASKDCPPESGGCTDGSAIYTPWPFEPHEQAHDYVFRGWGGFSTQLLNEGEAVALSCEPFRLVAPGQRALDVVGSLDWRNELHLGPDGNGYVAAGYFVTHLIQHYGLSNLESLHRQVPYDVTPEDFERAFAAVYPVSMDQAWSESLGTAGAQPCLKDWMCSATPMSVGDDAPLACDGQFHRSVTVTDQAGIGLAMHGGNQELTLVAGCADAAPSWTELTGLNAPSTHWVALAPGTYTLAEMLLVGGPSDVALRGYLPAPFLGQACATAGAAPLGSDGDTFIYPPLGQVSGWIGVSGGAGQTFSVSVFSILDDPTMGSLVELCDGCGATATCVDLSTSPTVTLGDQAVVHLQNAYVLPASTTPGVPLPYVLFERTH